MKRIETIIKRFDKKHFPKKVIIVKINNEINNVQFVYDKDEDLKDE